MLDQIREKLDEEIGRLLEELKIELPKVIETALEHGDLRENADYKAALERQQFVQARIGHLQERMAELSRIDVKQMSHDRAGFGSRVRLLDLQVDEEVELTIVAADYMELDLGHVSMASPFGRGLMGARAADEVAIQLPAGERRFKVLDVVTLPQQLGMGER